MPKRPFDAQRVFTERASERLGKHFLPRIVKCLEKLSDQQIWWRPNDESNSVGNLVLHLAGNIRQWIISGIGGVPDVRQRDREFSEQGPLPRRGLIALLRSTVKEACRVLDRMSPDSLGASFERQGYHMTRLPAIASVVEHLALHTGQIIYVTKLKTAADLRFTHLPKTSAARPAGKVAKRKSGRRRAARAR